jgi:hypothetical protein
MDRKFMAGFLFNSAIHLLTMDWYGQEAWIAHLRTTWVASHITIPVALLALVFCVLLCKDTEL